MFLYTSFQMHKIDLRNAILWTETGWPTQGICVIFVPACASRALASAQAWWPPAHVELFRLIFDTETSVLSANCTFRSSILNKCCRQKVVQARCRGAKKQFLSRMSTNRLLRRWQRLIRIGAEIIYFSVFCHSFSVSSINLNNKRLKEWNCNRSGIISQVDMILYSWKLIQYDHFEFIKFTI